MQPLPAGGMEPSRTGVCHTSAFPPKGAQRGACRGLAAVRPPARHPLTFLLMCSRRCSWPCRKQRCWNSVSSRSGLTRPPCSMFTTFLKPSAWRGHGWRADRGRPSSSPLPHHFWGCFCSLPPLSELLWCSRHSHVPSPRLGTLLGHIYKKARPRESPVHPAGHPVTLGTCCRWPMLWKPHWQSLGHAGLSARSWNACPYKISSLICKPKGFRGRFFKGTDQHQMPLLGKRVTGTFGNLLWLLLWSPRKVSKLYLKTGLKIAVGLLYS